MKKHKIILNEIVPLMFIITGILPQTVNSNFVHKLVFFAGIKDHKVIKIYGNSKISLDYCEKMELTIYEPRIKEDKDKDINKDLENIKNMCSATSFEDWTDKLELIFKTRDVNNKTNMKYLEYLTKLNKLINQHLSTSKEANELRELMDPLWNELTEYEKYLKTSEFLGNHRSEKISEKCIEPKVIKKFTN